MRRRESGESRGSLGFRVIWVEARWIKQGNDEIVENEAGGGSLKNIAI